MVVDNIANTTGPIGDTNAISKIKPKGNPKHEEKSSLSNKKWRMIYGVIEKYILMRVKYSLMNLFNIVKITTKKHS